MAPSKLALRVSGYVPAAAIMLVAGVAGWVATTALQQDFAAYWVAGAARRAGLDPYVNQVGGPDAPALWDGVAVFAHSRFLYPPVVAELFRALALVPYAVAKAVFTGLLVASWAVASFWAARPVGGARGVALAFAAGGFCYPLYLGLERGQVDVLVLLLLFVAFNPRARPLAAGAALAVAAAFKPGLVGAFVVLAALGRVRVVAAALAGLAAVALACVAISGPGLTREYATVVLPRAALYGEGGDESMLLPADRLAAHADALQAGSADLDGRAYRLTAWEGPASASLPRLLAPDQPTRRATRLPALVLFALLAAAARLVRRRGRPQAREQSLLWATAVACVIASPAGWVMGLVVALPIVPLLASARGVRGVVRALLGLALLGCFCPPPFVGWAAGAGTLLVAAAVALSLSPSPEPP